MTVRLRKLFDRALQRMQGTVFICGFHLPRLPFTCAARTAVCSTRLTYAAGPHLRIRASTRWSYRMRTPCPRSACLPIRRIPVAVCAARTDVECRTRSDVRPSSAAPDRTIRNRWWATRSSSARQSSSAKPSPSAHHRNFAEQVPFQRTHCGDHAPRKSRNTRIVPKSQIRRCLHRDS